MAIKVQSSFSTGELDPRLAERTTLEKFQKGLFTARNVIITIAGSIISRAARAFFVQAKTVNKKIVGFSPPGSGILLEFGDLYVRTYDSTATLINEVVTTYAEADLPNLHFKSSKKHVYIFLEDNQMEVFMWDIGAPAFLSQALLFAVPAASTSIGTTIGGTGYQVDYAVTYVLNGDESLLGEFKSGLNLLPSGGEINNLVFRLKATDATDSLLEEMRVFRRPNEAGAYGLIGISTFFVVNGSFLDGHFDDIGGDADFTQNPPTLVTNSGLQGEAIKDLKPTTGAIYQQRLILAAPILDKQSIVASQPGFVALADFLNVYNNFFRKHPFTSDSALLFRTASDDDATILHVVEKDGLIFFTTSGIFVSVGNLTPDNISLVKRGEWVIKKETPPLKLPGGVFFVDKKTNTIRQLIFSDEFRTYRTVNQNVFSNHLFRDREIISWGYEEGVIALLWVVFTDGSAATLTYDLEHEVRAWTRHDSVHPIESVIPTGLPETIFFVVNKDGVRQIEVSLPRYAQPATRIANPEFNKLNLNAFMDGIKSFNTLMNDSLTGSDVFLLAVIGGGGFADDLTLTCGTSAVFPDPGLGEVGKIFKFFNKTTQEATTLTVISRTSDNSVVVRPSNTFPSAQASGFRLYETLIALTGLDHLDDENVCVVVDGGLVASPLNEEQALPILTVSGGNLTLLEDNRGAFIIVGRPVVADIQTLEISTIEQSNVVVESKNSTNVHVRINESKLLYASNEFPATDIVGKMQPLSSWLDDEDTDPFVGNIPKPPENRRINVGIEGNWDTEGKVCLRQIDPVHFEILSIIPEMEVLRRSDR